MAETNNCPQCGAELPENAPRGLCPKCLIAAGFDSRDDSGIPGVSSPGHTTPQPRPFQPPDAETLAPLFPQLEVIELVGHGGMGAVYRARQKKLDRVVALKIIRPEAADDQTFADRFNREARTLARLNHSNIVAVYDFGDVTISDKAASTTSRILYYFLMEFVDGANLRQLIDGGELRSEQALAIVPQICEALQFAHEAGVVHRDIKPENILVDTRGQVKIADFGLAKLAERSLEEFTLTGTHQVMGTPRYMAPEQMEGSHGVDHRADIYSLGVVFYEMLTGQVPAGHFDPPSKKVQIDVRLDEVVLRSLAREPERRYQQASEVKTDVEVISQSSGTDAARTAHNHALQSVGAADRQTAAGTPVADVAARQVRQIQKAASSLFWLAVTQWVLVTLTLLIGTAVIYFWDGGPSEWKKALRDDDWTGGIIAIEFWTTLHAVIVITSALLVKQLRFLWLGVTSSLLVMLFPPANLAGLPIGIWSLVVLTSQDVRRLFQSIREGHVSVADLDIETSVTAEAGKPTPWFSGTVIGGMAVFLLLAFASVPLALLWTDPGVTPLNWPWPWLCFSLGGCLLSVFGVVAIGEIRNSDGQITGLGLATAEALAFPLLLLNGAIFGVWLYFNNSGLGMNFAMSLGLAVGETALIGGWASSAIIRRVRSAVAGRPTEPVENPESDSQTWDSFRWSVFLIEFSILTVVFGLAAFSMHWDQSTEALWMLIVPWIVMAGFGAYHDGTPEHRGAIGNLLYGTLWTVCLLGYGVTLGGLHTMIGIVASVVGVVIGAGLGRAIRGAGESDDEESADDENESHADDETDASSADSEEKFSEMARAIGYAALAMGVCGAIACWEIVDSRNEVLMPILRGNASTVNPIEWFVFAGPVVLLGAFLIFRVECYPLAVVSSLLCVPIGLGESATIFRVVPIIAGLWALSVLVRGDIRAAFRRNATINDQTTAGRSGFGRTALQYVLLTGVLVGGSWLMSMAMRSGWIPGVSTQRPDQQQQDPGESDAGDGVNAAGTDRRPVPPLELTGIHHAAAAGDLGAIRQLLQHDDVDINQKNPLGMTPLMYAAKNGHSSTTLALIVLGANINETDNTGQNALMYAATAGHADLLQQLREMENFASTCHRDNATAEQAADRFKQFPGIDRRILDEVTPAALRLDLPEDAQDNRGETALFKAAANGDEATVRVLADMGASQMLQDERGRTALMVALENGHTEFVLNRLESLFVLYRISNPSVGLHLTDQEGRTFLLLADEQGHRDIVDRVRSSITSRIAAFTEAIEAGRPHTSEAFFLTYQWRGEMYRALGENEKAGADLAASEDSKLREANHVGFFRAAVAEGDVERAKSLIASMHVSLDVNVVDADGQTALMTAAAAGHPKMVALLLALGALPDRQDKTGQTALMLAAENAHSKTVEMILRVCLVSNQNPDSNLYRKELEALAGVPLTQNGSDLKSLISGTIPFDENRQDANGETALMKAARVGDVESIRHLTGAIAGDLVRSFPSSDPTLQDKQGRTAFMHAVVAGQTKLVQDACRLDSTLPAQFRYALPNFCSPWVLSQRDAEGKTALQLAEEVGQEEIATMIRKACDETIRRMTTWSIDGGKPDKLNEHFPLFQRAECLEALGRSEEAAAVRLWFEWLRDSGNNKRNGLLVSLMEAAKAGNADRVKAVLAEHITPAFDPNSTGPDGETALMKAAAAGHEQIVAVLILRGANERARDKLGQTPLMHAAATGQPDVVKLLCDLNSIHYEDDVQFRVTRLDSDLPPDTDFKKMRFDCGAELQDEKGETALMKASSRGHTDCARPLLGVFFSKAAGLKDKSGRTALMHAVEAKQSEFLTAVSRFEGPGEVWGIQYKWATLARPTFFYPSRTFGPIAQPHVKDSTVVAYLEKNGMQDAAKELRSQIQKMIETCTKTIDSSADQKYVVEALKVRANLWSELGEDEKAAADEAEAERLKKSGETN